MKFKIKDPYQFNWRIRHKNGVDWGDWNRSTGEWMGIKLIQNQIRIYAQGYKSKEMQIEIIYRGKRLDFNGNETTNYITL